MSSPPPSNPQDTPTSSRGRGRGINLFDAVAGRITVHEPFRSRGRDFSRSRFHDPLPSGVYTSQDVRLAPEDVLFRQKNAPVRYAEDDVYWASDRLPDGGSCILPESDLLKAVHSYASRFYGAMACRLGHPATAESRVIDERSMDETALVAFGILLEEAGRHALGKKGDLVFTEAADEGGARDIDDARLPKRRKVAEGEYVEEMA